MPIECACGPGGDQKPMPISSLFPHSFTYSLPLHENTFLDAIRNMRLFYDAHAIRTFKTINLVLNVLLALAVLLSTHLPCLRARAPLQPSPASLRRQRRHCKALDHLIIKVMDLLACLTLASSL